MTALTLGTDVQLAMNAGELSGVKCDVDAYEEKDGPITYPTVATCV